MGLELCWIKLSTKYYSVLGLEIWDLVEIKQQNYLNFIFYKNIGMGWYQTYNKLFKFVFRLGLGSNLKSKYLTYVSVCCLFYLDVTMHAITLPTGPPTSFFISLEKPSTTWCAHLSFHNFGTNATHVIEFRVIFIFRKIQDLKLPT